MEVKNYDVFEVRTTDGNIQNFEAGELAVVENSETLSVSPVDDPLSVSRFYKANIAQVLWVESAEADEPTT